MRSILAAILLGVLTFSVVPMVQAEVPCSEDIWYLDSTETGTNRLMERAGSQSGSVEIGSKSDVIWVSDQWADSEIMYTQPGYWTIVLAAAPGTSFPTSDWTKIEVGYYDGSFHAFATQQVAPYYNLAQLKIEIHAPATGYAAWIVPTGAHLAVKIANTDSSSRYIATDGMSVVMPPCYCPGSFAPEMPTSILVGAGALALAAGFVWMGIRRGKPTVA